MDISNGLDQAQNIFMLVHCICVLYFSVSSSLLEVSGVVTICRLSNIKILTIFFMAVTITWTCCFNLCAFKIFGFEFGGGGRYCETWSTEMVWTSRTKRLTGCQLTEALRWLGQRAGAGTKDMGWVCQTGSAHFEPQGRVSTGQDKVEELIWRESSNLCPHGKRMLNRWCYRIFFVLCQQWDNSLSMRLWNLIGRIS